MKNLKFFSNKLAFASIIVAVGLMMASFQSNTKQAMSFAQKAHSSKNNSSLTIKTEMRGNTVWAVITAVVYVVDYVDLQVNGLTWTMCYAPDFERLSNESQKSKERILNKF